MRLIVEKRGLMIKLRWSLRGGWVRVIYLYGLRVGIGRAQVSAAVTVGTGFTVVAKRAFTVVIVCEEQRKWL